MDNYYTTERQILCVLDSRNGTSQNGSSNSIMKFYFEDPITKKHNSIHMSCSVLSFTCPNSIYNINETNSLLSIQKLSIPPALCVYSYNQNTISFGITGNYTIFTYILSYVTAQYGDDTVYTDHIQATGDNTNLVNYQLVFKNLSLYQYYTLTVIINGQTLVISQSTDVTTVNSLPQPQPQLIDNYTIPYGNYTAQNFMTQLISQIGSNYNISLNNITNIFTLNNSVYDFIINNNSTIFQVMGFVQGINYTSYNKSLTMPFTCNFNGLQSINIEIENFNTNNIDSLTKSNSPVIQSIPIDQTLQQIFFAKSNTFQFIVNQDTVSYLQIELRDDLDNLVNLNNQHFNLTLCFSQLQNIDRFAHMQNFEYIMKNGYN